MFIYLFFYECKKKFDTCFTKSMLLKSENSKYGDFIEEAKIIFGQNKKPRRILSIDILGRRLEEVHY